MSLLNHELNLSNLLVQRICTNFADEFEINLTVYKPMLVAQYQVVGLHLAPGAAYLEFLAMIAHQLAESSAPITAIEISDFRVWDILFLTMESEMRYLASVVEKPTPFSYLIAFRRLNKDGASIINRSFQVKIFSDASAVSKNLFSSQELKCDHELSIRELYQYLSQFGVHLGPSFQLFTTMHYINTFAYAKIINNNHLSLSNGMIYHPILIYAAFQLFTFFLAKKSLDDSAEVIYLPAGLESILMYENDGGIIKCVIEQNLEKRESYDLCLLNDHDQILMRMHNFGITKIPIATIIDKLKACARNAKNSQEDRIRASMLENLYLLQKETHPKLLLSCVASIIFLWATKVITV